MRGDRVERHRGVAGEGLFESVQVIAAVHRFDHAGRAPATDRGEEAVIRLVALPRIVRASLHRRNEIAVAGAQPHHRDVGVLRRVERDDQEPEGEHEAGEDEVAHGQ